MAGKPLLTKQSAELLRNPLDPERLDDLNAAIRRARPSVDSPVADWMLGRIDEAERDRRIAEKWAREPQWFPANRRPSLLSRLVALVKGWLA